MFRVVVRFSHTLCSEMIQCFICTWRGLCDSWCTFFLVSFFNVNFLVVYCMPVRFYPKSTGGFLLPDVSSSADFIHCREGSGADAQPQNKTV